MKISDLRYEYPAELIATEPKRPSRVLWVDRSAEEISIPQLIKRISPGDVLVINNSKVLKRRIFTQALEILFLDSSDGTEWDVLFPSRSYNIGDEIELPLGRRITLAQKGRPQKVRADQKLDEAYFEEVAELPLPPYIQKMRSTRHTVVSDEAWYQTAWAKEPGSYAAPTASLHFSNEDLRVLRGQGVEIAEITLHVGLGTFLPVTAEDLDQHEMHAEYVRVPASEMSKIILAQSLGKKIWAMGTTAARAVESAAGNLLEKNANGDFSGLSRLLIQPGYQWKVVDRLLTNFHQPESTLLAMVAGFAGLPRVREVYQYAIQSRFRLFSYGDLSVWTRE